jgi:hypothetical protein
MVSAMATITIDGKVAGQRRPLFADWQIPLPPEAEPEQDRLTLRGLITRVVLEEVEAFRQRQEQRRFVQALTRADIERGLSRGKVDMGGREPEGEVDSQAAVDTALLAFQDGLYYVFVDGEQQSDLEARVALQPDSRVTFLRLVALAGG